MTTDPVGRIADERLSELAIDLQVQLEKGTAMRPVLYLLLEARKKAVAATIQLSIVDPSDAQAIRICQMAIGMYDDMVTSCRDLLKGGKEARFRIHERDRAEMEDIIVDPQERELFNLEPQGEDS